MRKYTWIVFTNSVPDQEDEFNRWYDDVHISDLLRIPGVVGASRGRVSDTQMGMKDGNLMLVGPGEIGAEYKYVAFYEIETDDIEGVLREVKERSETNEMKISESLKEAFTLMYENMH